MAPVAQGLSDFEAKVVTARLGADGIVWELRGIIDSLYPFGRIDVLVPVAELEAARLSIAAPPGAGSWATEIDRADAVEAASRTSPRRWLLVATVIMAMSAFAATRVVAAMALPQQGAGEDCSGSAPLAAGGLTVRCGR
jgi:hypothetical protein